MGGGGGLALSNFFGTFGILLTLQSSSATVRNLAAVVNVVKVTVIMFTT